MRQRERGTKISYTLAREPELRCFLIALAVSVSLSTIGRAKQSTNALPLAAKSDRLDLPINYFIDAHGTPAFFLADILRDTPIPAGIAQVFPRCSDQSDIHLKVDLGQTIRQALNALVAVAPQYQWTLINGLVIMTPRGGAPPLLATKFHSFKWSGTDNAVPSLLMNELIESPEIRRRIAEFGLTPAVRQGPGTTAVPINPVPRTPLRIEFSLKNMSLMDAFSAIIRVYGHGMWVYTEDRCSPDGSKRFTIESRLD